MEPSESRTRYVTPIPARPVLPAGSYTVSAVPEPGATALWVGGAALLGVVRRRR